MTQVIDNRYPGLKTTTSLIDNRSARRGNVGVLAFDPIQFKLESIWKGFVESKPDWQDPSSQLNDTSGSATEHNGQLLSGTAIKAVASNSDRIQPFNSATATAISTKFGSGGDYTFIFNLNIPDADKIDNAHAFDFRGTDNFSFIPYDSVDGSQFVTGDDGAQDAGDTLADGVSRRVAIVLEGTAARIYWNGVQQGSDLTITQQDLSDFTEYGIFGRQTGSDLINGTINDFKALNVAMTTAELLDEYNNNTEIGYIPSTVQSGSLVFYLPLADTEFNDSGAFVRDHSGNGFHFKLSTSGTSVYNPEFIGWEFGPQTALANFNRTDLFESGINYQWTVSKPSSMNVRFTATIKQAGQFLILSDSGNASNFCFVGTSGAATAISGGFGTPTFKIDGLAFTGTRDDLWDLVNDGKPHVYDLIGADISGFTGNLQFGDYSSFHLDKAIIHSILIDADDDGVFEYSYIHNGLSDTVASDLTITGTPTKQHVFGLNSDDDKDITCRPWQYERKIGMLNFQGAKHKGFTVGTGPATNGIVNFYTAIYPIGLSTTPAIFDNRIGGNGLELYLTSPLRLRVVSEVSSTATELTGDVITPLGEWKHIGYSNNENGDAANIYVGDESSEMSLSGAADRDINTPSLGVQDMHLFSSPDGGQSFDGLATTPLFKIDAVMPLSDFNQLRTWTSENVINGSVLSWLLSCSQGLIMAPSLVKILAYGQPVVNMTPDDAAFTDYTFEDDVLDSDVPKASDTVRRVYSQNNDGNSARRETTDSLRPTVELVNNVPWLRGTGNQKLQLDQWFDEWQGLSAGTIMLPIIIKGEDNGGPVGDKDQRIIVGNRNYPFTINKNFGIKLFRNSNNNNNSLEASIATPTQRIDIERTIAEDPTVTTGFPQVPFNQVIMLTLMWADGERPQLRFSGNVGLIGDLVQSGVMGTEVLVGGGAVGSNSNTDSKGFNGWFQPPLIWNRKLEREDAAAKEQAYMNLLGGGQNFRDSRMAQPNEWGLGLFGDDQQYAAEDIAGGYPANADPVDHLATCQWMVDKKTDANLQVTVQVGDGVDDSFLQSQYDNMSPSYALLVANGIDVLKALGNHDYRQGTTGIKDRQSGPFNIGVNEGRHNDNITQAWYNSMGWKKVTFWDADPAGPGKTDNLAFVKTIDGQDYVFVMFEMEPRQAAIEWFKTLYDTDDDYTDNPVIITTHHYMDESRGFDNGFFTDWRTPENTAVVDTTVNSAEDLVTEFLNIKNLLCVLCGHQSRGRTHQLRDNPTNGYWNGKHAEIFFDYKLRPCGADGLGSILFFDTVKKTIRCITHHGKANLHNTFDCYPLDDGFRYDMSNNFIIDFN